MYKRLIRPLLFRLNAEAAHNFALFVLGCVRHIPFGNSLLRLNYGRATPSLETEAFGLKFPNPVGLAAGMDKNGKYYNEFHDLGFGFTEIGSITAVPQQGNPKPRMFRLPADKALVNHMGINNKGVSHVISNLQHNRPRTIVMANIAKSTVSKNSDEIVSDYETCFSRLYDFVDMFAVNVSCPNVEGLRSLQDVSFLSDILDPILNLRLCYEEYKPILVKVSPDIGIQELDEILDWCMMSGIDGIVAGNTTTDRSGLSTDEKTLGQIGSGGLSGAPLYKKSLPLVRHIKEYCKGRLGIIGAGGIMTPAQAGEMLDAGADLVEVFTGFVYEGPSFIKRITKYLQNNRK